MSSSLLYLIILNLSLFFLANLLATTFFNYSGENNSPVFICLLMYWVSKNVVEEFIVVDFTIITYSINRYGQTCRHLNNILKEHKRGVINGKTSVIFNHCFDFKHKFSFFPDFTGERSSSYCIGTIN